MADLDKAGGQDVKQETSYKLDRVQGHQLGLVAMGRVSPAERHSAILHMDEPPVGDGDPVRVASQVFEDLLGAPKGALGMDDPMLL